MRVIKIEQSVMLYPTGLLQYYLKDRLIYPMMLAPKYYLK